MEKNQFNNKLLISSIEKEIKKKKRVSKLVNYYKKINNLLLNTLSQGSGFLPGLGPIKSISEGIVGKDLGIIVGLLLHDRFIKDKQGGLNINNQVVIREMKIPERLLKILAGGSGLTGYYIFLNGYFSPTGLSLEEGMDYIALETLNIVLYGTSLITALGMKQAVKHTRESVKKKTQKIGNTVKKTQKINSERPDL